ncbi:universal stress protein [Paraoerskovia marina]|uniref:universal stress protein n=1 Tax=Paraoerskovia marina TaxID=545619 RepID=UPI000492A1E5|nr:universal stress protein [Paraoerskovia marina]
MTVLVAYNDSPQGEAALRRAHAEAARRETTLEILVLTPQAPEATTPAALAHVLDTLGADPTITYRSSDEEPSDAILDASEDDHVDLVVIGSRKRSAVSKFLLGSTTTRVLLDAAAPVLVVKGSA